MSAIQQEKDLVMVGTVRMGQANPEATRRNANKPLPGLTPPPFKGFSTPPVSLESAAKKVTGTASAQDPKTIKTIEDRFLDECIENKTDMRLFLANGTKLMGHIIGHDERCVLYRGMGVTQLIYKHSISTVCPEKKEG